jgi:hypothetical protein
MRASVRRWGGVLGSSARPGPAEPDGEGGEGPLPPEGWSELPQDAAVAGVALREDADNRSDSVTAASCTQERVFMFMFMLMLMDAAYDCDVWGRSGMSAPKAESESVARSCGTTGAGAGQNAC